jgi:dipeptidase E
MKLFLASSLDRTIKLLTEKLVTSPSETKVLFVANAADPYTIDKFWVRADKEAFANLGFQVMEVDLREMSVEDFAKNLKGTDILHMCGGSVLYLISLLGERGMQSLIGDAVKNNEVIYTGTSAGSMVVSNNLELCAYDQEELDFVKGIKDFTGLGLVNFLIIPHSNQEAFIENHKEIIEHLPQHQTPLIFLQDDQAVWAEDSKFEILSV